MINKSNSSLDNQTIGMALYGLQGMDGSSAGAGAVLAAFVSMDGSSIGVEAVLTALAPKIQECNAELTGQEIGNALYGLQGMDGTSPGARAVLAALEEKINNSSAELSGQSIGNALYGLQGMRSDLASVKSILVAMRSRLSITDIDMTCQNIVMSLFGLLAMGCQSDEDEDWSEIVLLLVNKAFSLFSSRKYLSNDTVAMTDMLRLYQYVVMALANFNTPSHALRMELIRLRDFMEPYMNEVERLGLINKKLEGHNERRLLAAVSTAMSSMKLNHRYEISGGVLLHGFDADIVIKRILSFPPQPSTSSSSVPTFHPLCINIESDGKVHKLHRKKRFCRLRDKYLEKEKDTIVLRISVDETSLLSDHELVTKLTCILDRILTGNDGSSRISFT